MTAPDCTKQYNQMRPNELLLKCGTYYLYILHLKLTAVASFPSMAALVVVNQYAARMLRGQQG